MLPCDHEIAVFSLNPGEYGVSPSLLQRMIARIRLDVVEHAVEVARFKAIDLDDDARCVLVPGGKDIALFADKERRLKAFDIPFRNELVDGPIGEVIKDIVAHLLVFTISFSATGHVKERVRGVYKGNPKELPDECYIFL